jgi:hypothetical protein
MDGLGAPDCIAHHDTGVVDDWRRLAGVAKAAMPQQGLFHPNFLPHCAGTLTESGL